VKAGGSFGNADEDGSVSAHFEIPWKQHWQTVSFKFNEDESDIGCRQPQCNNRNDISSFRLHCLSSRLSSHPVSKVSIRVSGQK
jgi:hypothetical protein